MPADPIDTVRWIDRDLLTANDYNPNSQVAENYSLLVESLQADGWTQPIVARPAGADGKHVIIDGEHRWLASAYLDRREVPVVVLERDEAGCIAATVRHNRARGSHGVAGMIHILSRLRAEGQSTEDIKRLLGMNDTELARLEASEERFLGIMAGRDHSMTT